MNKKHHKIDAESEKNYLDLVKTGARLGDAAAATLIPAHSWAYHARINPEFAELLDSARRNARANIEKVVRQSFIAGAGMNDINATKWLIANSDTGLIDPDAPKKTPVSEKEFTGDMKTWAREKIQTHGKAVIAELLASPSAIAKTRGMEMLLQLAEMDKVQAQVPDIEFKVLKSNPDKEAIAALEA